MRSLLIAVLLASGCVSTYTQKGPLAFEDVPYTSLAGTVWPERKAELPNVARAFGLAEVPTITYVELNPTGRRTLVFVHGLGSYLKFWRYQLEAFAEQGYRVIAADMVGYGKSDKPADFPYTMPAMAEVVRELLEQKGINDFALVGHSMGGHTSLSYAIAYPQAPKALVLVSPAGFEKFSQRDRLWFTRIFTTSLVKAVGEEGLWNSVRYNNFMQWKPDYAWLIEDRARVRFDPAFDAYAYANVRSVHGLLETDYTRDNLERIEAPTLIAYGDGDRLIPNRFMHGGPTREIMAFGAANIEGSEMVGFSGCGHTLQIDCSEALNAAIAAFLAKAFPLR